MRGPAVTPRPKCVWCGRRAPRPRWEPQPDERGIRQMVPPPTGEAWRMLNSRLPDGERRMLCGRVRGRDVVGGCWLAARVERQIAVPEHSVGKRIDFSPAAERRERAINMRGWRPR